MAQAVAATGAALGTQDALRRGMLAVGGAVGGMAGPRHWRIDLELYYN
jgi:hypothetical protein